MLTEISPQDTPGRLLVSLAVGTVDVSISLLIGIVGFEGRVGPWN